MKAGDTVRFLNSTGGGRVTRIEGRVAYVSDEDGFETPVLINELVTVASAETQAARTAARDEAPAAAAPTLPPRPSVEYSAEEPPLPRKAPEETPYGDKLNVALLYEPHDIKQLSTTSFDALLVNDSNYTLSLDYLVSPTGKEWTLISHSEIEPNTMEHVDEVTRGRLSEMTHVAVQFTIRKEGKPFERKLPVWCEQKLDMTKFFKLHCFRPNIYSDTPVIGVDVMIDDRINTPREVDAEQLRSALAGKRAADERPKSKPVTRRENGRGNEPLVVDLHINELLDSTAGLSTADILNYQIDRFRSVMDKHLRGGAGRNAGKKIIFIHGKGEGVLRNALLKELAHRYKSCDVQDASFREYGFGATQVTLR